MTTQQVLQLVLEERDRQETLRAQGRFAWTCSDPGATDIECLNLLLRELGEVAVCVNVSGDRREKLLAEQTDDRLAAELIQAAAVAVAWAERKLRGMGR